MPRLRGTRYAACIPSIRLLIAPDAAQRETRPAPIRIPNGRAPITRNWRTTRSSVPGGTIWLRNPSSVAATNSVRVCTMMAAALVSIGKKESIAEYAAPLADPMQPSLKVEIRLRRISHQKVRRFISIVTTLFDAKAQRRGGRRGEYREQCREPL